MKKTKTTIQISKNTLERLKVLREYERQSYEELLNKLIDETEEETLSEEEISEIQAALEEVKQGKVYSIEQVAKELGILLK